MLVIVGKLLSNLEDAISIAAVHIQRKGSKPRMGLKLNETEDVNISSFVDS